MTFAVLCDIHGNLEALKAVYAEAKGKGVTKIYHLGDLGGYAPFVNEVVEFIIEHDIDGVQGNYDETVANEREHCGCKYEDPVQEEMANLSFEWTKRYTAEKTKAYLKKLPSEISFIAEGKKVLLFHATPHKNSIYWYENRPEKFLSEMAVKTDADVLIYGHTHRPYWKDLGRKIFINAGSVGKPKDGDSRACLTVVEITKSNVVVEFSRIPYDVEKVATAIVEKGLPPCFAERLRAGK